jgi:hypothetical protein
MTRILNGWARATAPFLLAFSLVFSPAVHREARAQPAAPGEEEMTTESKGRPLDGYLATICLVLLALFVVGKSARR